MFTIRNQVFMMTFQQPNLVEFFLLKEHDGTYTKLQEIHDFPLSVPNELGEARQIISVPFYK